ncbi:hypothetical protein BD560DRAFT_441469 [Blakeslea trispora]|nr:hypothetical protein BD560DRAFT_441469 [Blakeslea trispora]
MFETHFTGTIICKNTIITVDGQAGLCAKTTIKNDGEKLTIISYDAGLIYTMIKLKEGDNVSGKGKSGHYAKLSSRNKPYVCHVATLSQLVTPKGILVEKQELNDNYVLYLVYRWNPSTRPEKDFKTVKFDDSAAKSRVAQEDRLKNKSLAQRLQEKIMQHKLLTEKDVNFVRGAVVASSSPSSSSQAFKPHTSAPPNQEDIDIDSMNVE